MTLKSNIPALRKALPDALERGVGRAALFVQNVAEQLVPVDTTALRRTIRVEGPETQGDTVTYQVLAGDPSATRPNDGQPVNYAPYVEYGTSSSPAQPFMTPAARAIKSELEVKAEVKKAIRGVRL
jgi:HK97 gp10 family phage protein